MRKLILSSILLLLAFGVAAKTQKYIGTLTELNADGSFVMRAMDGNTVTVVITDKTKFKFGNDKDAQPGELKPGRRVLVTIGNDGTASEIRLPGRTKSH